MEELQELCQRRAAWGARLRAEGILKVAPAAAQLRRAAATTAAAMTAGLAAAAQLLQQPRERAGLRELVRARRLGTWLGLGSGSESGSGSG